MTPVIWQGDGPSTLICVAGDMSVVPGGGETTIEAVESGQAGLAALCARPKLRGCLSERPRRVDGPRLRTSGLQVATDREAVTARELTRSRVYPIDPSC